MFNFNLQYKLKNQRDYLILSNSLSPDQRTFLISDLRPATWYNLFITAFNEAGSTGAEYTFATLTESGEPLPPPIANNLEDIAQQLKIVMPTVGALVVMVLVMGVFCAMFIKRQNYHQAAAFAGQLARREEKRIRLAIYSSHFSGGISLVSLFTRSTSLLLPRNPNLDIDKVQKTLSL